MDVIWAEGKLGKVVSFHYVQKKLHHIQFGTRSVVPDDIVKSLRMDEFRIEPHTTLAAG